MKVLRSIQEASPDDALGPDDPQFNLQYKPRGVFDVNYLHMLDKQFAGGISEVVSARINKDGSPGATEGNDACTAGEFTALLRHVHKRIGEASD